MQRLGNAAAIAIGCVSLLGACYHEHKWRRMVDCADKFRGVLSERWKAMKRVRLR